MALHYELFDPNSALGSANDQKVESGGGASNHVSSLKQGICKTRH
jgi:hypothetical protein